MRPIAVKEVSALVPPPERIPGFSTAMICRSLDYAAQNAEGDPNYRVISYDLLEHFYAEPSKQGGEAAREMLSASLMKHIEFRNPCTALDAAKDFSTGELSFCFIDANHQHPWPALDLLAVSEIMCPGGIVVLHDINLPSLPYSAENPALGVRGVESLFNDLNLEREIAWDSIGIPNIGSVRLPHDKHRLRRQLVDIIHGHPWESEVAKNYLAKMAIPRSGGLRAGLRRTHKRQGCLKVNSGAVFRDLNTAQREHPLDVVGQCAQTLAN